MKTFARAALLLLAAMLCACASAPATAPARPYLRLSPASLGHELVLQQRLTVTAQGQSRQFEVALEVDAAAVRLAVLDLGQSVARLEWDGRDLRQQTVPGWPASVGGEQVLDDLQLVHWPLEAIRGALPGGWSLSTGEGTRTLRFQGQVMADVRYPTRGTAELSNHAAGYRVLLETPAGAAQ